MAGDTFGEDPLVAGWMAQFTVSAYRKHGLIAEIGKLGMTGRSTQITGKPNPAISPSEWEATFLEPVTRSISADPALGVWFDPSARLGMAPLFDSKFIASTARSAWGLTGPLIAEDLVPPPAKEAEPAKPVDSSLKTDPNKAGDTTKSPPPAAQSPQTPDASPSKKAPPPAAKATPPVEALLAGCDLFSEDDLKLIVEASKTNPDVPKAMDRALRTVLAAEMAAGFFDPKSEALASNHPADEMALLQARAARESIVLLKNEGDILPLKKAYKTVAVIGPAADSLPSLLGSDKSDSTKATTPLSAIRSALGDKTTVLYEKGTGLLGREDLQTIPPDAFPTGISGEYFDKPDLSGTPLAKHESSLDLTFKGAPVEGIDPKTFSASWVGAVNPKDHGRYGIGFTVDGGARLYIDDNLVIDDWNDGPTRTKTIPFDVTEDFYVLRIEYRHGAGGGGVRLVWSPPEKEPYRAAVEAAIKADLVILVLGLDPSLENASTDRRDIGLPDSQEGLLEQIAELHRPTILVLLNGGPVSTPVAKTQVPAIVEAWYPGASGGTAIADVLTGAYNPSGKLPVTVYRGIDQLPNLANPLAPRGYRYSIYRPLFPFGSGMSYTRFAYSNLNVPMLLERGKPVIVGVNVKNVGKLDGDEVAELYVSHQNPPATTPRIALKAFRRIHLKAGESRRIVFSLTEKDLAMIHEDGTKWLEPEEIRISVGGNQPMDDQPPTVSATLRIPGPKATKL